MRSVRYLLAAFALLWQLVYLRLAWPKLPARLPSHFGLDGMPDRFAPRGIVWFILGISVVLFVILTVVERQPRLFNLPAAPGSPNRARQEMLARDLLGWIRLELALTFCYLLWSVVNVGLHQRTGLGAGFAVISIATVALTLGFYFSRIMRSALP